MTQKQLQTRYVSHVLIFNHRLVDDDELDIFLTTLKTADINSLEVYREMAIARRVYIHYVKIWLESESKSKLKKDMNRLAEFLKATYPKAGYEMPVVCYHYDDDMSYNPLFDKP